MIGFFQNIFERKTPIGAIIVIIVVVVKGIVPFPIGSANDVGLILADINIGSTSSLRHHGSLRRSQVYLRVSKEFWTLRNGS